MKRCACPAPKMPTITGSTTVSAKSDETAASTALPPAASISAPAADASGWLVTTIPRAALTGRFSVSNTVPAPCPPAPAFMTLLPPVLDELLRRVVTPLADERFFRRQQVTRRARVEPVGVGPALVHAAPRIAPVVVDLAAEEMPAHAPHVLVLAEPREIFVVLEHGVDVR